MIHIVVAGVKERHCPLAYVKMDAGQWIYISFEVDTNV